MDNVYYMDDEIPTTVNYPEVGVRKADIQTLIDYGLRVQTALDDYNSGNYDKIDVNQDELNTNVNLCRDVCNTLGTADTICFDILLQLRSIQTTLQSLLYLKREFGSQYVGTPSDTSATDGGVL